MKIKQIFAITLLVLSIFTSCKDDDKITPEDISNLHAYTTPGQITLKWNNPEEHSNIRYIKITYFDPELGKTAMKTTSVYSDSVNITNTRKKYGPYKFDVASVSHTETSGTVFSIEIESEIAPIVSDTITASLPLKVDYLSTNAQEPTEGVIDNLLDGDTNTFFHTQWSGSIPSAPHWLQVYLGRMFKDGDYFKFYYAPRNNNNNKPIDFDLQGSTDGENWFLIKNFTKEIDGLPTSGTASYTSPIMEVTKDFDRIRMVVNKTNTNTVYWTMSEFKFYNIAITSYDPEAELIDY